MIVLKDLVWFDNQDQLKLEMIVLEKVCLFCSCENDFKISILSVLLLAHNSKYMSELQLRIFPALFYFIIFVTGNDGGSEIIRIEFWTINNSTEICSLADVCTWDDEDVLQFDVGTNET